MNRKLLLIAVGLLNIMGVDIAMALELSSPAFQQGDMIPAQYTCDGNDMSPPLIWKDAPAETKSYILVVDDPDAPKGTWDHWLVYNIPATVTSFSENLTALPEGALHGKNSWEKLSYGGPCPPDKEHRYFFTLYALDTTLPAKEGMTKSEIQAAISGHVIAKSELVGKYQRSK